MGKVIIVGSLTMDVTAFASPLPKPGETVLGTRFETIPGGKGANQAVAAARAGAQTVIIGCIGTDVFGDMVWANLETEGISTDGVSRVDDRTGVAHIRVDAAGQNDIVVVPLANGHLTPELADEQLRAVAQAGDVLLVQLEVPFPTVERAIATGKELGMRVILDPAPAPAADALTAEVWDGLFAVTPNEFEAAAITGADTDTREGLGQAAAAFTAMGVQNVLLTLGERGSYLDGELYAAAKVQVIDTTAAGDVFAGYLGAAVADGEPLSEALRTAMAAGSIAVTRVGASASVPYRDEVLAALQGDITG
ncbi:MAG: ribokinase [Propionibacteriaceae bacterium]|nr:ribokinase [Propionibacteriaceae bacterium]